MTLNDFLGLGVLTSGQITLGVAGLACLATVTAAWLNNRTKNSNGEKLDRLASDFQDFKEANTVQHGEVREAVQGLRDEVGAVRADQSAMLELLIQHTGDRTQHDRRKVSRGSGTNVVSGDDLKREEPRMGRSRRAS